MPLSYGQVGDTKVLNLCNLRSFSDDCQNVIPDFRFNVLLLQRAGKGNRIIRHASDERSIDSRGLGKMGPKGLKVPPLVSAGGYRSCSGQNVGADQGTGVVATKMLKLVMSIPWTKLI